MKIYIDTVQIIKMVHYLEIIQQIPNKEKKILYSNPKFNQRILKMMIEILNNEMIEKILKYYEIYMLFSYTSKIKISNIKLIYMLTKYLKLDYRIYSNIIRNQDINKFIQFENYYKKISKN